MKKIMLVFGTRPEAIKMAPLLKEFQKRPDIFYVIVCVTGQHREMLDQVLNLFEITPDYDLNIMKNGQDLYDILARVILGMKAVLLNEKPDIVFVHGDTITSSAVSLAAFFNKIPVAHVEAGLRTYSIYNPWPEEMNRQLIGRLATYHFSPTILNKNNLLKENIKEDRITVTGNTVIDALQSIVQKIKSDSCLQSNLKAFLKNEGYNADRLKDGRRLVLITGHRRENFGTGFLNICRSIKKLAELYPNVDFVYPVHFNPNVQKPVKEILTNLKDDNNIFLINPIEYLPFVYLMIISYLVLTDSGGLQEEAPSLGKPVLVMRDTTERPEAVEAGTVKLVGTNIDKIVSSVSNLLDDDAEYKKMSSANNPYGNGTASKKIVNSLISQLNL